MVLVLGAASLVLLLLTDYLHDRLIYRDGLRRLAVAEVRTALTGAHLWVEEYVTGDSEVRERIAAALDRATSLIDALLGHAGSSSVAALTDAEVRREALRLHERTAGFRAMTERRERDHDLGLPVGVGSATDVEYDRAFAAVLADADRFAAAFEQRQTRDRARARLLFRAILVIWVVAVGSALAAVVSIERRRAQIERVRRDSEARLLQAQKMDAVGRLAGGIAHDINNYLGAIRLQSDVARLAAAEGTIARKMDSIARSVERASGLIRQLLAFARRSPAQPRTLDLSSVLTPDLVDTLQRLIGEDIELLLRLDPQPWNVCIDPAQVEQIVVNLVVNARDALPQGGKITIETRTRSVPAGGHRPGSFPAPGDWVVLAVSDTGAGIPEPIRDKIFEPFFTTKAEAGNTGLGLSTVHGIVTQAGGHVWVYSETGRGTTFQIYLPRDTTPAREATGRALPTLPGVGGTERVLLVEDNEELRESACEMLATLGYAVVAAPSGEAALDLVAKGGRFDAVISDVVLPGIGGKELVDRVLQSLPGIRVVFVSGHSEDVRLRHGMSREVADFLPKPFTGLELAARVRKVLDA